MQTEDTVLYIKRILDTLETALSDIVTRQKDIFWVLEDAPRHSSSTRLHWWEPVFSTCVGVNILEVIQRTPKDAAILRVNGDTRAKVWPRVYEPFH